MVKEILQFHKTKYINFKLGCHDLIFLHLCLIYICVYIMHLYTHTQLKWIREIILIILYT